MKRRAEDGAAPARGWRDPWAWACALAVIPVLTRAWGAPLGEPVGEDFDYLHHATFARGFTLFDGGGSGRFWRPLHLNLYYRVLGGTMLAHPAWVAALHVLLLGVATLLLYRGIARGYPRPFAALVATAPLFSEALRMAIAWPANFGDVLVALFTALALHETARSRLGTALAALALALLSKETALVAALLLPWMPRLGPRGWRARVRWALAMAATVAAWAAAYLVVRARTGLTSQSGGVGYLPAHLAWALARSWRATFSLPGAATDAGPAAAAVLALGIGLLVAALVAALATRAGRSRLRAAGAPLVWGVAWFAIASATSAPLYPDWSPNRAGYASLGFGAATTALLAAAHPAAPAALLALRLVTLMASPPPPRTLDGGLVRGTAMDFGLLVRLQLLTRTTRAALRARWATAPQGMQVASQAIPAPGYPFGGSRALEVWYRDSTLRWIALEQVESGARPVAGVAELEPDARPHVAIVEGDAAAAYFAAVRRVQADPTAAGWREALDLLDQAARAQRDTTARVFRSLVAAFAAQGEVVLGRFDAARDDARAAARLLPRNVRAHVVLGWCALAGGDVAAARREAATARALDPASAQVHELEGLIAAAGHR